MEENKDVTPESKEEVASEIKPTTEELLKNREAELDRKNREIERLRSLAVQRQEQPKLRDPNDIKTWSDHELKAIVNSNDPSVLPYKDQANELLLDRKVDARLARQAETTKRVSADLELREKFPESQDPTSELASKMDEITSKYDLDKSPAGRLVAAKLAASELSQGKNSSDAKKTKAEQDRVTRVKGQMVDGDRPQPTGNGTNLDVKRKELADKLGNSRNEGQQVDAISQILQDRGFSRDKFFGK